MNLTQFLAELAERGVKLWSEGDTLRFRAPKGVLTSEDRDLLVLHKAKLISLLSQSNTSANDTDQTIVPVSEKRDIPLSFPQEQLWFLSQLDPNNHSYNDLFALRFLGLLNLIALEQSLNKIVARHAALRTNFTTVNGQPVQVIAESLTLAVPVIDLRNLPASEREISAQRLATVQAQQPFDLVSDPLIQTTVLKLTETEHILLLRTHHIVWDGWSLGIMWRELATFYNDLSLELPPLPVQYPDFAIWQQQRLTGDVLDRERTYWQQQLLDAPPLLELPTDRVRGVTQTFRGAHQRFAISKELTEALISFSRRQKVTLFMTLLAAFQTLLYRYTGQTDICVGSPIVNRERPEFEGLIGFFSNTLVLRTCLSGDPSFENLLSRVRKVTLGAYSHRELPFEKLVEILQPERSLSYTPLFQVMLVLNEPMPQIQMAGLTASFLPIETATAKFDLTLSFENTASGLIGEWEYNTDLFDASTIARMSQHFQTLLEGIVANPQQRVSQLPLLTERERHQLLVEWNNTTKEYPQDKCIHQLFEEQVEQSPSSVAVVFEGEQLTYQQLNARANRIAHYLQSLGVGPEVLVGICVERSLEMVVGLLGILKAGGAYLPLDPQLPHERLSFMLSDSSVPVLLTTSKLMVRLPKNKARVVCLDTDWGIISQESEENPVRSVEPQNLAYVIYTSGSTGAPKGTLIIHLGLVNYLIWCTKAYAVADGSGVPVHSSIGFDATITSLFSPLLVGLKVVLLPEQQEIEALGAILCSQSQFSLVKITPAHLDLLSLLIPNWSANNQTRAFIIGGEALSAKSVSFWRDKAPSTKLINEYGPTETVVGCCVYEVDAQTNLSGGIPIGRPIANTQLYILDPYLQPVPIGVLGELYIGGAGVARGYINRPDLTQEKFIPNPFSNQPGSRLYKTGDKARYLSDGNIEFLGRLDNQVKIRGFRIELGEIEAAITQYPGVRETAVTVLEDVPGQKYLVAYIVPGSSDALASSDLRSFLKEKLPDYMIPGAFVMLDALPLTPNGKVDRRALPAPEFQPELQRSLVAPRTPIEEMLASIWADVLRIELVGVHHNFFELGGHSLLATQVISRVRDTFAVELPLRSLFEAPTIAEFASWVENSLKNGQSQEVLPLLPIPRSESIPLSFVQARLWFLDQLQPNSAFYNIPLALRLSGQLNIAALQSSINEIIRRHEALRTNFTTQEGQPVQIITTTLNCQLQVVNLLHIRESERETEAQRLASVEANRPFNLEREPLLRSMVLQLGETEYVLLFTMHHIISDGWSLGVFTRELTELYKAFGTGITPVLPSLPVQYADFALWQRQWLTGEVLEKQLDYWKQQLAGAPEVLALPIDRPRQAVQAFRGATVSFLLPNSLSEALKALSKRTGVTLFMTLYAAFVTLLYRYTGSDDIVVGTSIANRNRPEIERLIGFFVNRLVLRTSLSGNPSFEDVLSRVRDVAFGAYAHQDVPFEKLVEELQPARDLSYAPLVQAIFVLNEPMPQIQMPGLTVSQLAVETAIARSEDLILSLENTATGLIGQWLYNTDLFDATTIARMAEHFQTLLSGIVSNPTQQLSDLPLLRELEQQQLLVSWNNTFAAFLTACVHQLFEEQVELTPDAIAVVFEDKQFTYRELNQRANCLAHYLRTVGVGPEVLVGICVERSLEMIVSLLGILKAGGAYLPLDPALPKESLAFRLQDAQVSILLTQKGLLKREDAQVQTMVYLDADWELIAQESEENPKSEVIPENLAYVLYTSGSTGQPKGVAIEHQQILNYLHAILDKLQLPTGASFANVSTFAADLGNTVIFPALCTGGCLHIISQERATDPKALAEYFGHHPIDCLKIVPTHLASLLTSKASDSMIPRQCLVLGGEAASWDLVEKIQLEAPNCRILNHYGPTETTVGVLTYPVSSKQASYNSKTVPIGRPIANTQVYILDSHQQPVPIGVPGELHIGGASLARGYLNRPDLTDEKFINPFSDKINTRLYKTGDLVRYLSDGNIEFLGRLDRQVKIRGFRIELSEVETAITSHPAVRETVVVARDDIPGHKYLAAYIVSNQKEALTSSTLRDFLKEKLPNYMVPGAFVMLNALPLTPNGKVDHQALPTPDTASQELETNFVAPRTRQEELLARIWCEVLHLQQVSIHDNFFSLGGDSILSILIIAKAKQAGLQLAPKQIFQHQTIAELAAVGSTTGTRKAEQDPVTGSLPLTPIQHWFFAKNLLEADHYNQASLLLVPPTFDSTLLQQALQQLLVHHDALRLRFTKSEEGWQQFNALPDEAVPFSLVDLSALPETEQTEALVATSAQLQASLNLHSGPLVRVALFNLGDYKPSRLLLVIHHLAVDGVSWRILLLDLQTAYQQLESSCSIQLPAKTTGFKHWAFKLTEYARSSVARKELTYWQSLSRTQITRLPLDHTEGANTVASARTVSVSLNFEETSALLQEVPKAYRTQINDVLLTALVQVLGAWSRSNSVLVELEGHGREEILSDVDLSRTVGWFTTRFPVLLQHKETDNPGDSIKSIKEQLGAVPNRGIGYGLLRYLSGDASITSILQALPMAEVSFNYLGQFDWGMQADSLFKLAPESVGPEGSLLGHRSHLLAINGIVVEGQLQLGWTYSENFHNFTTIESLAQDYASALRSLIAHCLSPSARSYIPDVSENPIIHSEAQYIDSRQHEEDNATVPLHLLELPEDISELLLDDAEAAYPIAKMQEFMLYHYKNDHQKMGVYHSQKSYDIYDESLDLNAFKKALEILVQKHPALRTVFITSNGTPVVQVVKKSLSFSISEQDISHIKSDEQENYLDVVMKQDRQNLFNIENPNEPLFRFGIFRKAKNRFEFLMSVHHAIADGWGSSEFLNQLYELYGAFKKGEEITVVPDAHVYKEFVALEKEIIGSLDAADFWRLQLRNYVYKPLKPCHTSVNEGEVVACEHILKSDIISDLQKLCSQLKVSPKAIFLSTYLDLIGTLMKEKMLCVGTVSNGRTERLSDPFGALGLFWNMVPFCQPISSDKGVQIKNVQQSLIDMEPYVRYPLLQILADQQKPELFFATFNFVNFHNAKNSLAYTGLKVHGRRFHDKFNFPLNCAVSMSPFEGNATLHVEYDKTYFSHQEICSMIQNYIEKLNQSL